MCKGHHHLQTHHHPSHPCASRPCPCVPCCTRPSAHAGTDPSGAGSPPPPPYDDLEALRARIQALIDKILAGQRQGAPPAPPAVLNITRIPLAPSVPPSAPPPPVPTPADDKGDKDHSNNGNNGNHTDNGNHYGQIWNGNNGNHYGQERNGSGPGSGSGGGNGNGSGPGNGSGGGSGGGNGGGNGGGPGNGSKPGRAGRRLLMRGPAVPTAAPPSACFFCEHGVRQDALAPPPTEGAGAVSGVLIVDAAVPPPLEQLEQQPELSAPPPLAQDADRDTDSDQYGSRRGRMLRGFAPTSDGTWRAAIVRELQRMLEGGSAARACKGVEVHCGCKGCVGYGTIQHIPVPYSCEGVQGSVCTVL